MSNAQEIRWGTRPLDPESYLLLPRSKWTVLTLIAAFATVFLRRRYQH